ncbi:MAG: hypothetical protein GTO63_34690, partial [Anaerolineae bacterium]|nr:hypothetical protein [Anaerolineae bacterium]NIN99847.1 hypothetical protein [Anaerolineae bacterium]NIQ82622.1 hypothetical protein [Anaerolineae bacterium]
MPHIRPERLTLDGTQYGINLRGLLLAAFGADVSIGPHDRAEPPQALGIDDESEEIARGQEVDTPEALTEVS